MLKKMMLAGTMSVMSVPVVCAEEAVDRVEVLPDRSVVVREPNYDVAKIAPYTLEDPLKFLDGTSVTKANWEARRREILDLFAREMYGAEPPKPEVVLTELVDEKVTEAGFAVRRQYRMWFKPDKSGPCINWIVWLPKFAKSPSPVILFLNYFGNCELVVDPDIPLCTGWVKNGQNVKDHRVTEGVRGGYQQSSYRTHFPLGQILARGYAVMSACYSEVSPDPNPRIWSQDYDTYSQHEFAYTGVFGLWPKRDPKRTDNTTSLGAWGWALSRGLDLACTIPEIDAKRSVATGYSRLAKAALIAAARDTRFAVCVPIQTGGGGCPLAKRNWGENVSALNRRFPHWFCTAYAKYAADPAKSLTFDQHLFLATIAPRALLVAGFNDPWYHTEGEYLAVKGAESVWKMFGRGGCPAEKFPETYSTEGIGRYLGYFRRDEAHGIADFDWLWVMNFADGVFK